VKETVSITGCLKSGPLADNFADSTC